MIWLIANWRMLALAASYAAAFSGGVYLQTLRWEAADRYALAAIEKKHEGEAVIAADTENKLAKIEQENRTLKGKIINETHKSDYRCKLPADGLQLLQAARTGSAIESAGKVP